MTRILLVAVVLAGMVACTATAHGSPAASPMQDYIRDFAGDAPELLEALRHDFPAATAAQQREALEAVAHGEFSSASTLAAAGLCWLAGLGDPFDTAYRLYNKSDAELSEPQWFLWIAGYSYNWICNGGLSSCYFDFGERQFADRIRVYEAIGADEAAAAIRAADQLFGPDGPAASLEGRQAAISDELYAGLKAVNPRIWRCGDEINTRAYLYALEHAEEFRVE